MEERGRVKHVKSLNFFLVFEHAPVWLLALTRTFVNKIYMDSCKSFSELDSQLNENNIDKSLYHNVISCIGNRRFAFDPPPVDIITLISGSVAFLNEKYSIFGQRKAILITDNHTRYRRKLPQGPLQFSRLQHSMVGGATTYQCLYSYSLITASPKLSTLKRKLGDFIDYGVPPSTLLKPESFVDHTKLIPVQHLLELVQFPTHFSHNGLGYRKLLPKELARIFGFSTIEQPILYTSDMFPVVPIQLMDSLLNPYLTSVRHTSQPLESLNLPPIHNEVGYTFFPLLKQKLTHHWAHVSDPKAVVATNDMAEINQSIWDQRTTLLFPHIKPPILNVTRKLILTKHFRSIYLEFKTYLKEKFPSDYEDYSVDRTYRTKTYPCNVGRGEKKRKRNKIMDKKVNSKNNTQKENIRGPSDLFLQDLTAGLLVLSKYMGSSFMNWDGGSSLIFWRWPSTSQVIARDGIQPYILNPLPNNKDKTRPIKADNKMLVYEKLLVCLQKGYIQLTPERLVKNYIDYFEVKKGLTDIRVVFNGASCGLNTSLFASNFWLPTSKTLTRLLSFGYRSVDLDIGEMFPNFPLHISLQPYSGVDLSQFRTQLNDILPEALKSNKRLSGVWSRLWFGMKNSPEMACTFYYLAEEFIRGNHHETTNPLRWDEVILNLIGNKDYNPAFPNVYKWDKYVKRIAGELIAYIDDLRAIGFSLEHAWQIARRIGSYLQHLGIQDAARKRRLDEGPWAGGIYSTSNKEVTKTVTDEKWSKGKLLVQGLVEDLNQSPTRQLSYKRLERIRGFLCHLAMVYDPIFPYLKGFHLTLASHLPKRDQDGWKMSDLDWIGHIENKIERGEYTREQGDLMVGEGDADAPIMVTPVPRFYQCLEVLTTIFSNELPPIVQVRSTSCLIIIYGFLDASGSGFGSTLLVKGNIEYRIGTWSSSEDKNSSNWREFENLVCEVEQAAEKGWLDNNNIILATDNQVVEASLYKGNSTSIKLFGLVVRIKLVEMKYGVKIRVTHVSGTRMQAQGTDDVSRGSLKTGVAIGKEMIDYCPWGKSPMEVEPKLKPWIRTWAGKKVIFLSPKDWFLRGHDIDGGHYNSKRFWYPNIVAGTYVWAPPPAAADVCLEELRKARMKRKLSLHIVIIQRLMTPDWRKQLNKAADCIFTIPASHPFWPTHHFEPLVVAILFPYLNHRPFQLKSTPKMFEVGRRLSKMFHEDKVDGGNILFQLLLDIKKLSSMSQRMVWRMLYFGTSPPFSSWLPGEERDEEEYQKRSRKRPDTNFQQMERKRTKS